MMASPKLIAKVLFAVAATASGLQQNVGTAEKFAAIELGNSVPLSERGYQQIAAQRSDEEMKAFVHRVLAKEARYVKDVAELSGFVGFYSGTQGVQDLESLKRELRASPWVAEGEGRTAPLTDFGYQKVAKLKSNAHMMAFARRILNLNNKVCSDEGALIGLIPYYSGEVSAQSFDQLTRELLSAPWVVAPGAESLANMPSVALSEKTKEDPEPVETTIATTTTAATTTVVTTTLATTTLATTTLATTTLATTTLATTTVLTTLVTTTLPTTTLPEEEEEVEEALLEDVTFISKHSHDENDQGDDDRKKEDGTKKPKADNDDADEHNKGDATKAKKSDHAKADADHSETSKENKTGKSNATKKSKTKATKDSEPAVSKSAAKPADANATKKSKSKDADKGVNSWFGWLTR